MSIQSDIPRIAVVGASGAVGQEAISILNARNHPVRSLKLYGSNRSEGKRVEYLGSTITIEHLEKISQSEHDFVLLCATGDVARNVRDALSHKHAVLIDNSSEFRMDSDVPLVIPEVNSHLLDRSTKLVANPNCSTIMMLVALNPLRQAFGINSVIVTTYQAVSGAGAAGINELHQQTQAYLDGSSTPTKVFPCSCAFNVFEHESPTDPSTGLNGEETKIISETQRIWGDQTISILPTCVRVPVERAHAQSIVFELDSPTTVEEIEQIYSAQNGISRVSSDRLLTPRDVAGQDDVYIGRVRIDPQSEGKRVVLWICADQIRKGAALNAMQILDQMNTLVRL